MNQISEAEPHPLVPGVVIRVRPNLSLGAKTEMKNLKSRINILADKHKFYITIPRIRMSNVCRVTMNFCATLRLFVSALCYFKTKFLTLADFI